MSRSVSKLLLVHFHLFPRELEPRKVSSLLLFTLRREMRRTKKGEGKIKNAEQLNSFTVVANEEDGQRR